jgi:hypothetical protein
MEGKIVGTKPSKIHAKAVSRARRTLDQPLGCKGRSGPGGFCGGERRSRSRSRRSRRLPDDKLLGKQLVLVILNLLLKLDPAQRDERFLGAECFAETEFLVAGEDFAARLVKHQVLCLIASTASLARAASVVLAYWTYW